MTVEQLMGHLQWLNPKSKVGVWQTIPGAEIYHVVELENIVAVEDKLLKDKNVPVVAFTIGPKGDSLAVY